MGDELDMYTGKLKYKDINFSFSFDKKELRLIPPDDKRHIVEWDWKMKPLANGAYTFADPIPVDENALSGMCNETNSRIVFLPKQGSYLSIQNSVVCIELLGFVICKKNRDFIDKVTFSCPELNYIHPINQAFSLSFFPESVKNTGEFSLKTQNFSVTSTETQTFKVDEKDVKVYFGIARTVSTKINEPPLSLKSTLVFEFDALEDYGFILKLFRIAQEFISFLCYRKNVYITAVDISAPFKDGSHESFATMHLLEQRGETELDSLQEGRYIKQIHIAGNEGTILSDIASGNIYLRHIPETHKSGLHIDAARFVMITAAFEWEFRQLYPNGVKKSDETIAAEKSVSEEVQSQIDSASGKKKKIYKFLKRLICSDSLQSEISQIGKDFSSILDVFGNRLYSLNGKTLKYSEMGQRISDQRNHFAHGDLSKEFIGLSLLDLVYLEYVVYAMQLKRLGIEDIKIQKIINELFHCCIAI